MLKDKEKDLERYKAEQAHRIELIRATIAFEHAALKPTFILNGGALVVLFAFLGAVRKEKSEFSEIGLLVWALGSWSAGLLAAAIAAALGYKSQFAFRKSRERKLDAEHERDLGKDEEVHNQNCEAKIEGERGIRYRAWAEGMILLSLLFFLVGVVFGVIAFTSSLT